MGTNTLNIAATPAEHFKLYFYAAVLHIIERVSQILGTPEATFEQFPFLVGYNNELAVHGLEGLTHEDAVRRWRDSVATWEKKAPGHLPLRAMREVAGLDHTAITLLVAIGLIEEDARFGLLFEVLQGTPGQRRPTMGLLNSWWSQPAVSGPATTATTCIRHLRDLGLVLPINPDAPRAEWALTLPELLWDALRGEITDRPASWATYTSETALAELDDLILPDSVRQQLNIMPSLLNAGDAQALVIRGPRHTGRRTTLRAVARRLGRGTIEIDGLGKAEDGRWRLLGPLATLLHAMPLLVLDLGPGETADLPSLPGYDGPLGLVLGSQGGIAGPSAERALTVRFEMPDVSARWQHWSNALGAESTTELEAVSERYRMTSGNIRRTASLALSYAALDQRTSVTVADANQASRILNRQALDTLAAHVNVFGDWSQLIVPDPTLNELQSLEARCRNRERLHSLVGPALGAQLNAGVRALFTGPSGTGKTLAARILASTLQMDLYRLDLSSVVNKYIGETEKGLNQVFARAEELDVMLLLDEGDALLTQRTNVQTSNDRYANLETNYLLQRLESFEGILIVTTNAGDRIDGAFQRRMDAVIEFHTPGPAERWAIWQLHLAPAHAIEYTLLEEVAYRCELTGGQIRNAALHAALLAVSNGGIVTAGYLNEAVRREYRKAGGVCPLRSN